MVVAVVESAVTTGAETERNRDCELHDMQSQAMNTHTFCQLIHCRAVDSSTSTGLCCHLNGVSGGWRKASDGGHSSTGVS